MKRLAERRGKLLDSIQRIPGHDDIGRLQADRLSKWVDTVRDACGELDRLSIADHCIGQLLSHAPRGSDQVWPCEPVREVMEDVRSKKMMAGAHNGIYNSRGVVARGKGSAQERALAARYRGWADSIKSSHPFVAAELLMGMAARYEREGAR